MPCDLNRRPIPAEGIFHEKAGIVEDKAGYRIAWNGSLNETYAGWLHNAESFNIFTSWGQEPRRVDEKKNEFSQFGRIRPQRVITLDVPAVREGDLMRFLPSDDRPARMQELPPQAAPTPQVPFEPEPQQLPTSECAA